MSKVTTSIVIPAWNSEAQLKQNLASVLKAAAAISAEIIVVDDASSDLTVTYLKSLGKRIQVVANSVNLGFAQTVNKGIGIARGDIVILLNTDVRPEADCFSRCLKQFQHDDIFAVTFNSNNSWAGGWWRDGLLQHERIVANVSNQHQLNPSLWASGGQAAFDRKKWVVLGGMDPLYTPFYWEDVDLGYRAWKRGWRIVWDPDAHVVHDHQSSVIKSNFSPKYIHFISMRNQFLFVWKNIHDPRLLSSHLQALPRLLINYPLPLLLALLRLPSALRGRGQEKRASVTSDLSVLAHWK